MSVASRTRPGAPRGSLGRSLWLALLLLLGVGPARGHYLDLRGTLVEPGVLTVGVALTGRPFAYRQDGRVRGFEVDLAAAVAHSRGLDLRIVQLPRKRLAAALAAGEVDLVNTFALDGQAPAGVAAVPYLRVGDHMMVLKGNPFRIRRVEDLAGHTVAATAGTTAEAFAHEINRQLVADGRAAMNIHSFPNQRDTHVPVSMGHAAAYFVATASALVPTLDPDSRVRVFAGVFRPRREVGFGVRADHRELRDAVEHALAAKLANGTYDALRAKHGIPDDLSPFR
ncbi:MAG: transporter substrate-binding domain-containing protein [Kiloniellaceae bacterium]